MMKINSVTRHAKIVLTALAFGFAPTSRFMPKVVPALSELKSVADKFESQFTPAHRLIEAFEAGHQHSKTIGGEICYQVYYGKADKIADKRKGRQAPLLTVGHGHTQRGQIDLAGGQSVKLGEFIPKYTADSLFIVDLNSTKQVLEKFLKVPLKKHEEAAILSYAFNINPYLLGKPQEGITDTLLGCINQGQYGKAQSKFNIITAGGVEQAGLIKRRLIEMIMFGNGKIYKDVHAQKKFEELVLKLHKKEIFGFYRVIRNLEKQSIPEAKLRALENRQKEIIIANKKRS